MTTNVLKTSRRLFATKTHEVFNQGKPFKDFNLFKSDPALVRAVMEFCDAPDVELLERQGKICGSDEMMHHAVVAERNRPVLKQFDQYGRRVDVIDYHDSYHKLMKSGLQTGCSGYGFGHKEPGSHVVRCALIYMENQLEPGHCCPLTMTTAAIPVLQQHDAYKQWAEKLTHQDYDPRDVPMTEKAAVTAGMSMTEKQGGSDVRANTTLAKPLLPDKTGNGAGYLLTGHKWFTSAPMCDGFLTLAKTPTKDTPSCFLVPRWNPDGHRNEGFRVMRLKDKLGDRANASSEIEYDNAYGSMIGEEGKGVKTIIEMVQSTRLDCILGSAGTTRRALNNVLMHVYHRKAFGQTLITQPLMTNVLADLCIEADAHTLTAMYMSSAFDKQYQSDASEQQQALLRIGVAVSKYWVTKRLPNFTYECMEALGGNGYVEDFPMAMMYRQAPLNAIWEGSGNVIALDILRAFQAFPVFLAEVQTTKGMDTKLDSFVANLEKTLHKIGTAPFMCSESQQAARNAIDRMALALQASILLRFGDEHIAKGYIAARIANDQHGLNYGSYVFDASTAKSIVEERFKSITY